MKTKVILMIAVLMIFSEMSRAQTKSKEGIEFYTSWEKALEASKASNKPIFIDFYTTWCGPCVWMGKNTFTDEAVMEYYNENFISLKIDCDIEGEELQEIADVTAYPTLGFFSSDGEFITKAVGAYGPEGFLELGKTTFAGIKDQTPISGLDDKNFKFKFGLLMNSDPDKAEEMATKWLQEVAYKDISDKNVWFLVSEYAYDLNDPLVLDVVDNLAEINEIHGLNDYLDKLIENWLESEVSKKKTTPSDDFKAMYYRIAKGLNAAVHPENYYHILATLYFYNATEDPANFLSTLKVLAEQYEYDDWESLVENINFVIERHNEDEQLTWANNWADRAIELNENAYTLFSKAKILKLKNEPEEAIKYAEKAAEKADDFDLYDEITEWISYNE